MGNGAGNSGNVHPISRCADRCINVVTWGAQNVSVQVSTPSKPSCLVVGTDSEKGPKHVDQEHEGNASSHTTRTHDS